MSELVCDAHALEYVMSKKSNVVLLLVQVRLRKWEFTIDPEQIWVVSRYASSS